MSIFRRNKPAAAATAVKDEPFDETRYGMIHYRDVKIDEALGDAVLAESMQAARRGDWTPAASALGSNGVDWNHRMLRVHALANLSLQTWAWLDAWLASEPDSPHAATVNAAWLMFRAGTARGAERAANTSQEQFEAYFRLARESDQAAQRAIELWPEDPTPWVFRMSAALGRQIPHDEFTVLWNEAIDRAPMHRRAHTYAHQYWLAKWFGSEELSAKFVADAVSRTPRTPLALELTIHRAQEAWIAFRDASPNPGTRLDYYQGAGRPYLENALAQWDGELPTGGALEMVDRNLLAWVLTMSGRYDEACDVFQAIGASICTGFPWIYYDDVRKGFGMVRRQALEGSSRVPSRS